MKKYVIGLWCLLCMNTIVGICDKLADPLHSCPILPSLEYKNFFSIVRQFRSSSMIIGLVSNLVIENPYLANYIGIGINDYVWREIQIEQNKKMLETSHHILYEHPSNIYESINNNTINSMRLEDYIYLLDVRYRDYITGALIGGILKTYLRPLVIKAWKMLRESYTLHDDSIDDIN